MYNSNYVTTNGIIEYWMGRWVETHSQTGNQNNTVSHIIAGEVQSVVLCVIFFFFF